MVAGLVEGAEGDTRGLRDSHQRCRCQSRWEDRELTTPAPAQPLPALLTPSSLFHSFFSEGVSLMQPHFVFGDMKEILMLIIKGSTR